MIKKKKKNNRIILCICSIFLLVASIFSFIPFVTNETKPVYADTITSDGYQFNGSPILGSFSFWDGSSSFVSSSSGYYEPDDYGISWAMFYFSFVSDSNDLIRTVEFGYNHLFYYTLGNVDGSTYFSKTYNLYGLNTVLNNNVFINFVDRFGGTPYYYYVDVLFNNSVIIDDLYYLKCGKPIKVDISIRDGSTYIYYYDKNSNYIGFKIFANDDFLPENYEITDMPVRTYYFDDAFNNLTDNEYYNQGYSQGNSDGYNSGFKVGKNEGYNQGYSAGQTFGYNSGFAAGQEDTNQYTFLNLVSSVIDAPMTYFQSLFNFELLGVNLQGFLMALFTLCVVVTIVRLCLGK